MNSNTVPRIFDAARRAYRQRRADARQGSEGAARFIWDEMAEDMIERLAFVRHLPVRTLVIGPNPDQLAEFLSGQGAAITEADGIDIEVPYPETGFDFIGSIGLLDAVNDLPGALIHMRNALAPGGLVIASFVGGASLPKLRAAMFAADGDRPAARIHPMVDHRAAPGLLQRAGWRDPVVDTHRLTVRYASLDQLVSDLRDHGLGNALADPAPALGKAALERARSAFLDQADEDGKVSETFEIITLTGRR